MIVKTNGIISVVIGGISCIVLVGILFMIETSSLFLFIVTFLLLLLMIRYWVALGKTLTFTKEGCEVSFLWYKKFYTWDSLKVRETVNCEKTLDYRSPTKAPYKKSAVFSVKRQKGLSRIGPISYSIYLHPLSFFFVNFVSNDIKKSRLLIYEVDEKEFLEKMAEWGIELTEE